MSHLHRQYFSLTAAVPLLRQWTTRTVYYFSIYQIQLPIYKFLQYLKSRNHLDVYVSSVSCDILSQHPRPIDQSKCQMVMLHTMPET